MNIKNILKDKKKMRIIGIIVMIIAVVIFTTNEKAHSLLAPIINAAQIIAGTESTPAASQRSTSAPASTGSSTGSSASGSSVLPSTTPNYSTTNSQQLWTEIRRGYADGDQAAEAEMQKTRRYRDR
ncbi:MAG: hypothetical protein FWD26_00280 [Treponema sp.]|nr:hypothetical protein [Treponema sp.]